MRPMTRRWIIGVAAGLSVAGCRVEPGDTDYASQQPDDFIVERDAGQEDEFLVGPDPFVTGDTRLTFGPFYEGAQSAEIPVDDVNNFFFVFDAGGMSSLDITTSADRIEGFEASDFRHTGAPFWGMSLAFFDGAPDDGGAPRPEDLRDYETMHISLKSSSATYAQVRVGVAWEGGEANVAASDYGYDNDGQWHTLAIPFADFGADMSRVTTPLILVGEQGSAGDSLLVDNFYWSGS